MFFNQRKTSHKLILGLVPALITLFWFTTASAACTYNEAIMAFDNGNQIRGQALMNMAARDGDNRAVQYLAKNGQQQPLQQPLQQQQVVGNTQRETLAVMDSLMDAPLEAVKSSKDIN